MRSLRKLAVVVALLAFASACGGTSDIGELRAEIEDVLASELPAITVRDVSCGEPDLSPGSTFVCTAGVEGGRIRLQVVIDNEGFAVYERLNAVVDLDRVELEIMEDLTFDLGFEVAVDCGDGFQVFEQGNNFVCAVTASESTAGVRVEVLDVAGSTDWFFPVPLSS